MQKKSKQPFLKAISLALVLALAFPALSYAQMNTWGLFGGGKLSFPSATSAPTFTAGGGGIPAPIINGTQAWPQNWRGFNAAYDENGTLLFYVLTAISTSSVVTPSCYGAIFDASGNQITTIEGSGRTVAIVAYPNDCNRFLVLYHDEEIPNANTSDGIIWASEIQISPNGSATTGSFIDAPFFQGNSIQFPSLYRRAQIGFVLGSEWLNAAITPGSFVLPIFIINAEEANGTNLNISMQFIEYNSNLGGGSFYLQLAGAPTLINPLDHIHKIGLAPLPTVSNPNLGDMRWSKDQKLLIAGSGDQLFIKYDANGMVTNQGFSAGFIHLFTQIIPGEFLGVEIYELANGNYRIFTSERSGSIFQIKERNFNPATQSINFTAVIAQVPVWSSLNKDQFGRVIWVEGNSVKAYLPNIASNGTGSGTIFTTTTNSQPVTSSIQPILNLWESHHVPYINQGFAPISGFTLTSNCCERAAPDHWENTSATALGLATTISNRTITIDGVFQVNQNLTLQNCQVYLRPNARIQVSPGVHLQINSSSLQACKDMWDGIYLDHTTARITVFNPSWNNAPFIKHAINGIVVSNGAQFTLANANLLDNYRHLQVRNWTGSYANSITGTVFGCLATGIGRAPHINNITVAAVTLTNGGTINLGGTTLLPNNNINRNEIYRAVNGIFVDHASVEFNNWDIHDLTQNGVYATRGGTGYFIHSNFLNVIERMQTGITVLGHLAPYNVDLTGNKVGDVTSTGIYVGNCNVGNTIEIEGNEVKSAPRAGIWVSNSRDSWIEIIQNQVTTTGQTFVNTGILVMDPFAPPTNGLARTIIYNNTVSNYFSGIFVQNDAAPQIYGNTISINAATSTSGKGSAIFARTCPGTTIYDNSTNTLTNAFMGSKIGIGIESSPTSRIFNNILNNTSDGLYISGNCFPTRYYCNEMFGYWRGVVYNWALVGPQGTSTNPQGNKWYPTSGAFDTYSFNTVAAQWPFYAETMALPFRPLSNGFVGFQAISPQLATGSSSCGLSLLPSLEPIVYANQGFEVWSSDQAENAHFWALKSLSRDSDLLNQDQSYRTYLDNWNATNLGAINAYLMAVEDQDASQAVLLRSGLAGSTATEENFLASVAAFDDKFVSGTSAVNEELMTAIAAENSPQPTSAALLARWLLCDQTANPGFFAVVDESESMAKTQQPDQPSAAAIYSVTVSPRPANEVLQVFITGEAGQGELIGLDGRVIGTFSLRPGSQSISRAGIPAGMYYLKVTFQGGATRVEKIVFQ